MTVAAVAGWEVGLAFGSLVMLLMAGLFFSRHRRPRAVRFGLFLERDYDDGPGRRDELEQWPTPDADEPTLAEPERWNKTDTT